MFHKLIVLSGLPGSGKSKIAKDILYNCHMRDIPCKIYSYDKYHLDNEGNYCYNKDRAGAYISQCYTEFRQDIESEYEVMILDNVNSVYDEFRKFVDYYYVYFPYVSEINFIRIDSDIQTCYKRCTHKVPLCVIDKISKRMESIEQIQKQTKLIDNFFTGEDYAKHF